MFNTMIEIPNEVVDHFSTSCMPARFQLPGSLEQDSKVGKILREVSASLQQIAGSNKEDQPNWFREIAEKHSYLKDEQLIEWLIVQAIDREIAKRRLLLLNSSKQLRQIKPYDHPDLSGIELDNNSLVKLSEFDISLRHLNRGSTVFEILPSIAYSTNSMYWTLRILFGLAKPGEIKVRLDPLMVQQASTYRSMEYKMWVYGKELDWQDIRNLKEDRHMRWQPNHGSQSDVEFTDLVWSPRDNEVHFICEELPKKELSCMRGSRYFHSIFIADNPRFIHCDGAIRIYSTQEIEQRHTTHVRNIGKIGKRVKIFQTDFDIPTTDWTSLVSAFYVWNMDIERYFSESKT